MRLRSWYVKYPSLRTSQFQKRISQISQCQNGMQFSRNISTFWPWLIVDNVLVVLWWDWNKQTRLWSDLLWWHHFKSYHEPNKGWVGAFASAFLGFTDFELKVRHHYPGPIIKPALFFPNSWPEELWCIQIAAAWIMVCCNGPIELKLLHSPHTQ